MSGDTGAAGESLNAANERTHTRISEKEKRTSARILTEEDKSIWRSKYSYDYNDFIVFSANRFEAGRAADRCPSIDVKLFDILAHLGENGFGSVYKGTREDQICAIKIQSRSVIRRKRRSAAVNKEREMQCASSGRRRRLHGR